MNDSPKTSEMRLRMGLQGQKRILRNVSKMSRKGSNKNKRKAVAPVLATLLMIAVAVSMSVIIFMWSQGFLANTSDSTGSQQGAQNQAAQSSIGIDTIISNGNETISVIARNVGSVAVKLGSFTITSSSSNAGYNGSKIKMVGSTELSKGESAILLSDVLENVVGGDVLTVKISTTAGTFAQMSFVVP